MSVPKIDGYSVRFADNYSRRERRPVFAKFVLAGVQFNEELEVQPEQSWQNSADGTGSGIRFRVFRRVIPAP